MRDLNYELKKMCQRNCDGSFATQRDRERVLDLVANQLQELGYRHMASAPAQGAWQWPAGSGSSIVLRNLPPLHGINRVSDPLHFKV